ncbi:MAG: hypothetical protein RL145_715, partial [Pseudomonadota bacterium]
MMSQNSELRAVASDWQARARTGALKVCVIGMGYVGLPLARAFVDAGLTVVGFDIDQGRVDQLNSGESYFHHIDNEVVAAMVATGRFSATTIASKMTET